MAGDPDTKTSLEILKALPKAGADVIELGMPFTDPMADGPAIQAGGLRALQAGHNMIKTLGMVRAFRKDDDATPIVLMGYYNPIYIYGVTKFLADAKSAGVDGLIVVDLPPEEDEELVARAQGRIEFHPTGDADHRRQTVAGGAREDLGLCLLRLDHRHHRLGRADADKVHAAVTRIKRHTQLPVAVGFGVRTAKQARALAAGAEGVVVGSALVNAVKESLDKKGHATPRTVKAVASLVAELAKGVRGAKKT